jgi:hypothetical protein
MNSDEARRRAEKSFRVEASIHRFPSNPSLIVSFRACEWGSSFGALGRQGHAA